VRALLREDGLLVAIAGVYAMVVLIRLRGELVQDSWLALVGGREIVHHGIPGRDQLTFWTIGHHWTNQPWLAQLLLYLPAALGGVGLALVAHAVLVTGAFAAAFAAARALGGTPRSVAWIAVLSLLPIAQSDAMRTQSLVYPLFIGVVWLLARDSRSQSRLVFLSLPIVALWANLHGSAVLAAALVSLRGITLGFQRRDLLRRAAILAGLPWLCLFASPYGFALAEYYNQTLNNPGFKKMVTEWQASTLTLFHIPFYVLGFVCVWLLGRDRRLTAFERLALVLTLAAGLITVRNEVWFGYTALLLLPGPLGVLLAGRGGLDRRRLNAAIGLVGVAALVIGIAVAARERLQTSFPPAGARVIASEAERDPGARIFASIRFADWILWRDPRLRGRVAYDTRLEMLSGKQLTEIFDWGNRIGDDWRRAAAGDRILVLHVNDELAVERSLLKDPGVRRVYRDKRLSVLVRR
jgi:hypothetical protein